MTTAYRLRYRQAGTGYVKDAPRLPDDALSFPIIYGLTSSTAATDADVLAGTQVFSSDTAEVIVFPTPVAQRLFIAIPHQLGTVDTFTILNFPVAFNQASRTIFIDGDPYLFTIHTSQYPQNGVGITAIIP